jgi:tyrosinase
MSIYREVIVTKLSRRHLVAGGLAGAGASLFPGFIKEANAATATRYNLASPNGQAMLKKYAQAVKLMMALPPSNPLSWTFQWYTHAVPTNTTKAAALASIFPTPSPEKTLATAMWNTCQAHFNPADEPYFLPWHRMYVCYFEQIIRAVLHDPTFSLPYWNYSVPAGYPLPKEFRMQNDPLWGPLFRPNRRAVVNAGQPIFNGIGVAMDLNPASALAQPNYLPAGVAPGFNQALDQGVHGNVHVFVGNGQGMGSVPWAANDPIFWMHHCNIDRIWVSWNSSGHLNPTTAAWSNKTFVFAGPDGKGVKAIVKDYTNTRKCDYKYDQLIGAPMLVAAAAPSAAAAAPAAATTVAKSQAGPIALGAAPVRVNVQAAASPTAAAPGAAPLAARLSALPENRRLYLVINNIKAEAPPETLYRVYLDLPEGTPPSDPINSNYVGSFNFFDAVPHGDDHSAHGSKPVSFDVTNVVANLDARGLLKADHTVTIVPSNDPAADAKPVVGDISFVEQ